MKLAKYLLILFLSSTLTWTPCHASSHTDNVSMSFGFDIMHKMISNRYVDGFNTLFDAYENAFYKTLSNKYIQGAALTLSISFIIYQCFIVPALNRILLNACKEGNLSIIKFLLSMDKCAEKITKTQLLLI